MRKINYSPDNTRTCSKCKIQKSIDDFKKDRRASQGRGWVCTICSRETARNFYHKQDATKKAFMNKNKELNALRNKKFICEYLLKQQCELCGEKDIRVLDFDHCKGEKNKDICQLVTGGASLRTLKHEISLCRIICNKCHRIQTCIKGRHYKQRFLDGTLEDPSFKPGSPTKHTYCRI